MKNIALLLITTTVLLGSCTKIIDIELDEADKRTSIDAQIEVGTNTVSAKITKSGNFFGSSENEALTDATVTLNDGTTDYSLINMGLGYYELPSFTANGGQTYTMKVTQAGENFEASSSLPYKVEIDTVLSTFQDISAFSDSGYLITLKFYDPASASNYYRVELDIAGERYGDVSDLLLVDDELTNGNYIEFPLFGASFAQLGDTVTVYLRSVNQQSFDYFVAVDEILFGAASTPANPKSNFNNNALGNFSAFATDTMTIVVQ